MTDKPKPKLTRDRAWEILERALEALPHEEYYRCARARNRLRKKTPLERAAVQWMRDGRIQDLTTAARGYVQRLPRNER